MLAHARGDLTNARRLADEALGYREEHILSYHAPLTFLVRGRVYLASGELDPGLRDLEQACETARVFGMRPILLQTHAAAVDGLVAVGRLDAAESKRTSAQVIAAEIANQISDRELRDVYLQHILSKIH